MANITLSQSFLDKDLRSITSPGTIFETWSTVIGEIYSLAIGDMSFDSAPVKNGNTYTLKNPSYTSSLGTGTALGSSFSTYDSDGNFLNGVTKFSGGSIDTGDGKGTLKGSFSSSYKSGINSRTQNYTEFSFKGDDSSSWSLKGIYNETYSYNNKTEAEKRTLSISASSVLATDSDGNSIAYSGNVKYDANNEE